MYSECTVREALGDALPVPLCCVGIIRFTFTDAVNTEHILFFLLKVSHTLVQFFKGGKLILFYFHCIPFAGLFISLSRSKFQS